MAGFFHYVAMHVYVDISFLVFLYQLSQVHMHCSDTG